jgi:hypothetical protein
LAGFSNQFFKLKGFPESETCTKLKVKNLNWSYGLRARYSDFGHMQRIV